MPCPISIWHISFRVGLEEFKLSPHTEYEDRMRKLGKRLSRKLGINYFDFIDESVSDTTTHSVTSSSLTSAHYLF